MFVRSAPAVNQDIAGQCERWGDLDIGGPPSLDELPLNGDCGSDLSCGQIEDNKLDVHVVKSFELVQVNFKLAPNILFVDGRNLVDLDRAIRVLEFLLSCPFSAKVSS